MRKDSLMIKKILVLLVSAFVFFPYCADAAETPPSLMVKGLVEKPLKLNVQEINRLPSIKVQLNEIMKEGDFQGIFTYRGVPLRNILEKAEIQKKRKHFYKGIDLALRGSQQRRKTGEPCPGERSFTGILRPS